MSNVLFTRNPSELMDPDPDVWDDTLLIEAYERAVNPIKMAIASKLEGAGPSGDQGKMKSGRIKDFKVGMPVRALYSEDCKYYEGVVLKVFKDTCLIKYLGYNNKEMVPKKNIWESHGEKAIQKQLEEAAAEILVTSKLTETSEEETDASNEFDSSKPCINECLTKKASSTKSCNSPPFVPRSMPMIPPPIPPHIMNQFPQSESELISSMLMSWYMSGYHTGYWQGYKSSQKQFQGSNRKKRGRS
ncbi:unnamed protein product [Bemisia tabaci]|uniref:Tudor domain-containing protein n=1 Tax=Bemisia tabaci TaxID=7038 RepID=A0A9P0A0G7_BEMTA|nr:unnamed protein product [Bemisia tabaci]